MQHREDSLTALYPGRYRDHVSAGAARGIINVLSHSYQWSGHIPVQSRVELRESSFEALVQRQQSLTLTGSVVNTML